VSTVSTHVLDASAGAPAGGVAVALSWTARDGRDEPLADAVTDADGRVARVNPQPLMVGTYRLVFSTGEYFARAGTPTFYPQVAVTFTVAEPEQHYHVPLLLSPYAYSTYRGS